MWSYNFCDNLPPMLLEKTILMRAHQSGNCAYVCLLSRCHSEKCKLFSLLASLSRWILWGGTVGVCHSSPILCSQLLVLSWNFLSRFRVRGSPSGHGWACRLQTSDELIWVLGPPSWPATWGHQPGTMTLQPLRKLSLNAWPLENQFINFSWCGNIFCFYKKKW